MFLVGWQSHYVSTQSHMAMEFSKLWILILLWLANDILSPCVTVVPKLLQSSYLMISGTVMSTSRSVIGGSGSSDTCQRFIVWSWSCLDSLSSSTSQSVIEASCQSSNFFPFRTFQPQSKEGFRGVTWVSYAMTICIFRVSCVRYSQLIEVNYCHLCYARNSPSLLSQEFATFDKNIINTNWHAYHKLLIDEIKFWPSRLLKVIRANIRVAYLVKVTNKGIY